MKKSRLALYIGLPAFGYLSAVLASIWPDLIYINLIPGLVSAGFADMIRTPRILVVLVTVAIQAAFWLPIAYGIDMLWRHFERKRKRSKRRRERTK